jgi:hypothetical protein
MNALPIPIPSPASRLRRSVGLAVLAAVFAMTAAATPAAAATGNVGAHSRAQVTCDALNARLLVHLPMVASVPLTSGNVVTVGGWTGGGNHPQLVGVRAWLLRWDAPNARWAYTDQNRDGYYDATGLLTITVLSDGNLFDSNWWNATARRPLGAGDTLFGIRTAGYYKVNVEYFWYADQSVGSGYDVLDSVDHFYTQWFTGSKPYCTY